MGAFEKITVSVSSETATAMRESVADGRYLTESEIVRHALEDWKRSHDRVKAKTEWLRKELARADKGPFYSDEEVTALLEASFREHEQA